MLESQMEDIINERVSYTADHSPTGDVVMVFNGEENNPIMVSDISHFWETELEEVWTNEEEVEKDGEYSVAHTYGTMSHYDYAIIKQELLENYG